MSFASLADVYADYELLEADDRYRLLIDLGRALEPMPDALKTDATLVRGCSASVWVYPVPRRGRPAPFPRRQQCRDHQGHRRPGPARGAGPDARPRSSPPTSRRALAPFDLRNQLSSNRTQGIPNMIALVRETAARLAA